MRLGRLMGVPVRINPVTIPMAALALMADEGARLGVMAGSVLLHELMHIGAARLMRVRVMELELMPVGGAARMESMWMLRPGQIAAVALAGPLFNLMAVLTAAALCWWGLLPPLWTALLIEQNAVILAFNLLPALPLDGGRALCGLLSRRMPPAAVVRYGIGIGRVLALLLAGLSVYGMMKGRLNITLPVASVFFLMSAGRERSQAEGAALESLTSRMLEMEEERVLPVKWLAVYEDTPAHELAAHLSPRRMHIIAVYDAQMNLTGVVSEAELLRGMLTDDPEKTALKRLNVKKKVF